MVSLSPGSAPSQEHARVQAGDIVAGCQRVVDGPVGADVDLQRPGSAGREPQRETIGRRVAGDGQRVGGDGGDDRGFGGPGQDRDGGEDEAQGEQ